jgi:hypothetical protein
MFPPFDRTLDTMWKCEWRENSQCTYRDLNSSQPATCWKTLWLLTYTHTPNSDNSFHILSNSLFTITLALQESLCPHETESSSTCLWQMHHWILSWARLTHFIPSFITYSFKIILILSSHPFLINLNSLFPSFALFDSLLTFYQTKLPSCLDLRWCFNRQLGLWPVPAGWTNHTPQRWWQNSVTQRCSDDWHYKTKEFK